MLKGLARAFAIVLIVVIYRGAKSLWRKRLQKKADQNGCWLCAHCLIENPNDKDVCHYCGKKRFESDVVYSDQAEPTTNTNEKKSQKCELCGKETEDLIDAMIKDDMGIRYRNVCADCFAVYNAKKRK